MDSIATSSTEDSDGEDINRGGLLVALFIVVIFVVAFCLFAFSSVCDIFWYVWVYAGLCDPTLLRALVHCSHLTSVALHHLFV